MKKIVLSLEDYVSESTSIGLVRLIKHFPSHQLFFKIGKKKNIYFQRKEDISVKGRFYEHYHAVYQAYDSDNDWEITFITNKSVDFMKVKEIDELFIDEDEIHYLLNNFKDVDYIIKVSSEISDYNEIGLPNDLMFHIQNYELFVHQPLWSIIN